MNIRRFFLNFVGEGLVVLLHFKGARTVFVLVFVYDVVRANVELHTAVLARERTGCFVGFTVFPYVVFTAEAFAADVAVEELLTRV